MLARGADGDCLLFLLNRRERTRYRQRNVGPPPRQIYELECRSTTGLQRLWTTRLLVEDGGHPATGDMKLLGLDADRVWVFVREPVLVSLRDGAIVPDAPPYLPPPPSETPKPRNWDEYDAVQEHQALASGSIATKFRISGGRFGDGWFGVLSEDELRGFRSRGKTPVLRDGDLGRDVFAARPGEDGDVINAQRLGDATVVAGGLLREKGSVEPLRAADPDGAFVLHRDLSGYTGSWRLARVDLASASLWDVALPIAEIEQLWQVGDAVLMVGPQQTSPDYPSASPHAVLIAIDAGDGSIRSTDLESDAPATP
jgi:hypothetical protein